MSTSTTWSISTSCGKEKEMKKWLTLALAAVGLVGTVVPLPPVVAQLADVLAAGLAAGV